MISPPSAKGEVSEASEVSEVKGEESSTSAVIEMPVIGGTERGTNDINPSATTPVVESSSSSSANTVVVCSYHLC